VGNNLPEKSQTWAAKDCVLLHDNALAHWLSFAQQQVTNHHSHLKPRDFYLSPWRKDQLKGCHFKDTTEVHMA
jgi:hypothetical protein